MVQKTNDPQGPPSIILNLFVWGFVSWALMGPLSRWAISEILFYVALERLIVSLDEFRALAEPRTRKEALMLRLFYWLLILGLYIPRYFIINKAHDPNNYLENRPDLWAEWGF